MLVRGRGGSAGVEGWGSERLAGFGDGSPPTGRVGGRAGRRDDRGRSGLGMRVGGCLRRAVGACRGESDGVGGQQEFLAGEDEPCLGVVLPVAGAFDPGVGSGGQGVAVGVEDLAPSQPVAQVGFGDRPTACRIAGRCRGAIPAESESAATVRLGDRCRPGRWAWVRGPAATSCVG